MLKALSSLYGISGFEEDVADFVVKSAKPYADRVFKDSFGNVYVYKKGINPKKTVMLCAHTDEVGLIVSSVTEDGYVKFRTVGGIDSGVLPAKGVYIGEKRIKGVIGYPAAHLSAAESRKKKVPCEELYIDIGAADREEALSYVRRGDPSYFEDTFEETESMVFGKAFDDRAGCFVLLTLLKEQYENDLYFVFTAQEETGLRGAQIASRRIEADEYIVVENTTCLDMPGVPREKHSTALGGGPALTVTDGASFANVILRENLAARAPHFQYKNAAAGGNDAGAISKNGKCVAAVSVPCRYLHTPVGVISKTDLNETVAMLSAYLKGESLC